MEAELLRRGAASVTFSKRHLHATNSNHSRTVELRVKVKTKRKGNWITSVKEAKPADKALNLEYVRNFWVFVDLASAPRYWIVPDGWIRNDIHEAHQEYLKKNGGHRPINDELDHHSREPLTALA